MIRRAEVVTGLRLPSGLVCQQALRMMCVCANVLALIAVVGCKGMPTLVEQERLVQANNLVLDHVTARAVVNVWGEPPHY